MKHIEIYTDGACSGNPGPGGWGAILRFRTSDGRVFEKELHGGEPSTTNNRMELTALLEALRQLKEPCDIDLFSDSQYVINGLEKGWAKGWRARGWKKAPNTQSITTGSKATPATPKTSAATRWRWRRAGSFADFRVKRLDAMDRAPGGIAAGHLI